MTPKEKAKDLLRKYWNSKFNMHIDIAIQCALIAVDEILKVTAPEIDIYEPYYQELDDSQTQVYWQEVKQEIEKL